MSKRTKSNAVPIVLTLFILSLICCLVCVFAPQLLNLQARQNAILQQAQAEVEEENARRIQAHQAAVAEYQSKTAVTESEDWPAHKQEGWDIVDLSNFPLRSQTTETMTRAETMNNGLLLVNQWHSRPDDFNDSTLVGLGNYFSWKVQVNDASVSIFPVAADALKRALDDAEREDLTHYIVAEGYRSWDTQNSYFQARVNKLAEKYTGDELIEQAKKEVNYPGTSEFNTGLSFRLKLYSRDDPEINKAKFSTSSQGKWMNEHCWEYGLIFRFPLAGFPNPDTSDKSFVTGIRTELNLYRYVGVAHATIMHHLDLCLEEYIEYLEHHPHIAYFEDGKLVYEIYRQYVGEASAFDVILTDLASSHESSMDNMGGIVTVFEY